MVLRSGIDVGSTTVKLVILDEKNEMLFSKYERHYSDIQVATNQMLKDAQAVVGNQVLTMSITGSGGMGPWRRMRTRRSRRQASSA